MAILKIRRNKGVVYKVVLSKLAGRTRLTKTCNTKSEAKLWECKLKLQSKNEADSESQSKSQSESQSESQNVHTKKLSLKEIFDDWLETNKSLWQPGTFNHSQRRIQNLKELFEVRLPKLSAFVIDKWLAKAKRQASHKRVNFKKEIAVLKAALNWYREYRDPKFRHEVLKRHMKDACIGFRQPLREQDLSYEDKMRTFVEAFRGFQNQTHFVLAAVMYYTGLRVGEAAALCTETVNLAQRTLMIDRIIDWDHKTKQGVIKHQTKTKINRVVLIPDPLILILRWWIESKRENIGSLVFHRGNGEPLTYTAIQNAFYRAKRISGLKTPGCTHFLRHAFATRFAKATGDIRATSRALGHTQEKTTQHYVHLDQQHYKEKWGDFNKKIPHLSLVAEDKAKIA